MSILLSEGKWARPPSGGPLPRLPQTALSLCVQVVKILNHVARIDLPTLQGTLADAGAQEFYHIHNSLLDYCCSRVGAAGGGCFGGAATGPGGQSPHESRETELLHETVVLIGYYCLLHASNQALMRRGEGQTLLTKLTSLPLPYFMEEKGRQVLFPTLVAICFRCPDNLGLLRNEMNLTPVRKFILAASQVAAAAPSGGGSGGILNSGASSAEPP